MLPFEFGIADKLRKTIVTFQIRKIKNFQLRKTLKKPC
jgi:hypothetical protein